MRTTTLLFALQLLLHSLTRMTRGLSQSLLHPTMREVVVVKVGGSSITKKNERETLDEEQIQWFSKTLVSSISDHFKAPSIDTTPSGDECEQQNTAFVIIHGAGSFGHHQAKEHGLSGKTVPATDDRTDADDEHDDWARQWQMQGLAKTRLSVQKLNRILVESLVTAGINAVGISPCFAAPSLRADGTSAAAARELRTVVADALVAGIVPVLHGDACLHGPTTAGILSGDTLFQMIGTEATRGVFLTDVNGVYGSDPRLDPNATFVPAMGVIAATGELVLGTSKSRVDIAASASLHPEDTTGGFKTKLASALEVVRESGTNVTIARCGSDSAANALRGVVDNQHSLIYRIID